MESLGRTLEYGGFIGGEEDGRTRDSPSTPPRPNERLAWTAEERKMSGRQARLAVTATARCSVEVEVPES